MSPGVYVIEKDISDYTPAVNPTVVGLVGFATRGPVNKPTLITSQERLIKTFGRPDDELPGQAIEGALEILETCNQNYFVRASNEDTNAEAHGHVSIGGCPAFRVNGVWGTAGANADLTLTIQVHDHNGVPQYSVPRVVTIPSDYGAGDTIEAVMTIIGGELDADKIGAYTDNNDVFIVGNWAGALAKLTIAASDRTAVLPLGENGDPLTNGTTLEAVGSTFKDGTAPAENGLCYYVESVYPGTGYNTTVLPDGTIVGNSVTVNSVGSKNVVLNVNDGGVAEEAFKVSLIDGNFVEDLINVGSTELTSEFIKGRLYANQDIAVWHPENRIFADKLSAYTTTPVDSTTATAVTPRFVKFVGGNSTLTGGANGDEDEVNVLVGGVGGQYGRTGMQALINETAPITIAIIPGITDMEVQNNLITLAENSGDFLAAVATPVGYNLADAISYSNGQDLARSSALNSSYAAIYYPWVKVFQPYLGKDIWLDPSIFGVRQMGYTDTVSDLWFAPAGFVRGRLTKPLDSEVDLNQGDRDSMYSGGNVLNPIVKFPQQGLTIFGQRTTQRAPTALDRINVRRLMIYIKRVITQSTTRFVFEPNDKITQERIEKLLVPLFEDIKRRRGITEFKVVCDETVNTPVRVDRNELWCKILIKPTKAAEVLVFELNITNQAANIG